MWGYVKQLLLVGQVIITSRELGFSINVTPSFEGKPNANHVRARISNSRTQRLHK
jgi:hypothetical protein